MLPKGRKGNTGGSDGGMRAKEVHLEDNLGWPELCDDYGEDDSDVVTTIS